MHPLLGGWGRWRFFWACLLFISKIIKPFIKVQLSDGVAGFAINASYNIIFKKWLIDNKLSVASSFEKLMAVSSLSPIEAARIIVLARQSALHFSGYRKILALAITLNAAWIYAKCRQEGEIYIAFCLSQDLMFCPYIATICKKQLTHRAHGRINDQLYDGYKGKIIVSHIVDQINLEKMRHHYNEVVLEGKAARLPWVISPNSNKILWLHGYRKGLTYSYTNLRVDLKKMSGFFQKDSAVCVVVSPHPSALLLRWALSLMSKFLFWKYKLYHEQYEFRRIYCSSPSLALELDRHKIPYEKI